MEGDTSSPFDTKIVPAAPPPKEERPASIMEMPPKQEEKPIPTHDR